METTNFISVPTFSLTPNRLSLYNSICKEVGGVKEKLQRISRTEKEQLLANLHGGEYTSQTRWHEFKLSESGRKTMQLKINWLYFMAKSRYKKTLGGAEIYNFKINFMTLTLPAKQVHPTAEITKTAFNQFLTEIRDLYKMENYVWRIEFQKNGNVHYHIVTDTFTEFYQVQKIWNRCLSKMGYVAEYHKKHALMSLNDYVKEYSDNGKNTFDVLKRRYFSGKALNWSSPNSVDVKSVTSGKKIAFYISKYFGKKQDDRNNCNALDTKENSTGIRLWFCSRSLSKLNKISDFIEPFKFDLLSIVTAVKDTLEVIHEYCTSYFFSFSTLLTDGKEIIHKLLYNYARGQGYEPQLN